MCDDETQKAAPTLKTKDDNAYRITRPWVAFTLAPQILGRDVPDYAGLRYSIVSGLVIINASPDGQPSGIDGATGVLDKFIIDLAPGFLPHDLLYLELERHAADPLWKAAGWDVVSLRKLWDGAFAAMIAGSNDNLPKGSGTLAKVKQRIKRLYSKFFAYTSYPILRGLGGLVHIARKPRSLLLLNLLFVLGLMGCAQWAIDGIVPTGDPPPYIKTNTTERGDAPWLLQ